WGLMFSKIINIVRKVPKVLRTASNVADVVANCVEDAQAGATRVYESVRGRRGAMRDMTLQQ
nr:small capsid protein [Euprosterna elaeasa virus]